MRCKNCGEILNKDFSLCTRCGSPIDKFGRRKQKILIAVAIVLGLVVLAVGIIVGIKLNGPSPQEVRLNIVAQGYNPQKATRFPVSVEGSDINNNKVDKIVYVDINGEGLNLMPGKYKIKFIASPLSESGVFYEPPANVLSFEFRSNSTFDELLEHKVSYTITKPKVADVDYAYKLAKEDDPAHADAYRESTLKTIK